MENQLHQSFRPSAQIFILLSALLLHNNIFTCQSLTSECGPTYIRMFLKELRVTMSKLEMKRRL